MSEITDTAIRRILLDVRTIAMVGASAKPDRPSFGVRRFLAAHGFRVFPINPGHAGETIDGTVFLPDLAALPGPVDMVDVFRANEALPGVVDEVLAMPSRPRILWMQLGVRHHDAAARARDAGIEVVMDRCPAIEWRRLDLHRPADVS